MDEKALEVKSESILSYIMALLRNVVNPIVSVGNGLMSILGALFGA